MYKKILVALDNSPTDRAMFPHISELAKAHGSELLLLHVADGWAARNYNRFQLAESEEMKEDRRYLEETATQLRHEGITVNARLALGDPPGEIINVARAGKFSSDRTIQEYASQIWHVEPCEIVER